MTAQHKMRGLALGLAATILASAPCAAALAQPYGGYDSGYQGPPRDQYQADQYRQAQYEEQRRAYDAQYGDGAYDRYQQQQADPDRAARHECHEQKQGNEVGGALLGGIAGAVIGSNLGRGGGREGGAIIGGVGGAAAGSAIANNATHC